MKAAKSLSWIKQFAFYVNISFQSCHIIRRHIQNVHSKIKIRKIKAHAINKCSSCNSVFDDKASLKYHVCDNDYTLPTMVEIDASYVNSNVDTENSVIIENNIDSLVQGQEALTRTSHRDI